MEDIKIWALDGSKVERLEPAGQTESEQMLEDTLVQNPDLLMEGLKLIGRQTPTEGGPLDLLGVDRDGQLVVFELKRGTLSRDAVAQVIDYASYLDGMGLEDLASLISENSGTRGIDEIEDFEEWYSQNSNSGELEAIKPIRMFLVGLGVDDRTERMVKFLAEKSNMDISLLTFHGFSYDGKIILAKQVEVERPDDSGYQPTRRRRRVAEYGEQLDKSIQSFGVRQFFEDARDMFQKDWTESRYRPGVHGLNIRLPYRTESGRLSYRPYARIDVPEDGGGVVVLVFYPLAIALCVDEFRKPTELIQFKTYPSGRDALEDANTEIQFSLTADDWERHKETLTALVQAVYEAWENDDGDL